MYSNLFLDIDIDISGQLMSSSLLQHNRLLEQASSPWCGTNVSSDNAQSIIENAVNEASMRERHQTSAQYSAVG